MSKGSRKMPASFSEDLNLVRKQLAHEEAGDSDAELTAMLRQLSRPAIVELGNPVPDSNHLPHRRAARCPASHNRLLLGELGDESPAERARHSSSRGRPGRTYSPAARRARRLAESSSA